jgi:hypothetical protein
MIEGSCQVSTLATFCVRMPKAWQRVGARVAPDGAKACEMLIRSAWAGKNARELPL